MRGFQLTNECIASAYRAIQLRGDTKVNQFDLSIIGEQHVLALDVAMDDFVRMQIAETAQDFTAYVSDPFLFQALTLCGFDQIGDGASAAILHDQPELIIFARRRFLNECTIVGGNVAMI